MITLTATNRRLAELVGSGHSNQGTGAELFMSDNTVEAWCTRVASACGARSVTSSPRPSPARTGDSASTRQVVDAMTDLRSVFLQTAGAVPYQ